MHPRKRTPHTALLLAALLTGAASAQTGTATIDRSGLNQNGARGVRQAEDALGQVSGFLAKICQSGQGTQAAGWVQSQFNINGTQAMMESLCRIQTMQSEISNVLKRDSWMALGRDAVKNFLTGRVGDDAGPIVDQVFTALENGNTDIYALMTQIGNEQIKRLLAGGYHLEKNRVSVYNGFSTDPDVRGVVGTNGKLDANMMDEAIFDPVVAVAMKDNREALKGMGSVFAHQEGTAQSLEASAKRVAASIDGAEALIGTPFQPGAIEERIQASRTATSLREQMISQTELTGDLLRATAENQVSVLSQLTENARVTSVTNHLLAMQAERAYQDEMKEAQDAIERYKAQTLAEADRQMEMGRDAELIASYYRKTSRGSGMTEFSWDDIAGIAKDDERAATAP